MVVLDRRGTVPGHHPRYYRPPTLIGAGVGSRERRQDTVDLVPRHGTTITGDPARPPSAIFPGSSGPITWWQGRDAAIE